jgi:hypothetical protein
MSRLKLVLQVDGKDTFQFNLNTETSRNDQIEKDLKLIEETNNFKLAQEFINNYFINYGRQEEK